MLIPFKGGIWVCDFCLKSRMNGAFISKHTHAVICASCLKNPVELGFEGEPDPAVDTPKAAQSGESA